MKYLNPFFKKRKKTYFHDLLTILNIKNKKNYKNILINDIKNLDQAIKNDITFFHNSKYRDLLNITKSNFIITTSQLSNLIPKSKIKIIVENVLLRVAKITEFFYGVSDRGASIRIPMSTANEGKGYLEDRRPAANMDPYLVCAALIETTCN